MATFGGRAASLDQHHSGEDEKLFAAAAERNKEPIWTELQSRLPKSGGLVLEVASGTGQHLAFFAESLLKSSSSSSSSSSSALGLVFLPTEADRSSLPSIRAHSRGLPNVLPPRLLDVESDPPESWPRGENGEASSSSPSPSSPSFSSSSTTTTPFAAIYAANLTHISPFAATLGLFAGAGKLLEPGGALFLYGPFARRGKGPQMPSDAAFDATLRARDSRWGYRDVEEELVPAAKDKGGLALEEVVEMPANNFLLVFRKEKEKNDE